MQLTDSKPPIEFELSGGLGNQLFQYFAGMNLKSGRKVVYKISPQQNAKVTSDLLKFKLGEFLLVASTMKSSVSIFGYRVYKHLLRGSSLIRSLALRYFGVYQSQVVGFDDEFPESKKVKIVYGYFQSYLYVPAEIHYRGLHLVNPSDECSNLLRELVIANPIVIHIRGGDYRKLANSVGILSSDYYKRALEIMLSQASGKEIWVFSNDPDLAEQILGPIPFTISRRILDTDLSSEETLFLMSQANYTIISNSTFSWWAAYSRGSNKLVVGPTKWYRSLEDPKNLIPENWLRVESTWYI